MKKYLNGTVVLGIALDMIGVFAIISANKFPGDAGLFPRLFSVLMIALSTAMVIQELVRASKSCAETGGEKPVGLKMIGGTYLCILAYIALINIVGFFASTTVFLSVMMTFLGLRSWKQVAVITVGADLAIFLIFVTALNVTFPRGFLI